MEEEFFDIWYATPDLIHSHLRWSMKQDAGRLVVRKTGIEFRGLEQRFNMHAPKSITVVRSAVPWNQLFLGILPFVLLAAAGFAVSVDLKVLLQFLGLIAVTLGIGAIASRPKWMAVAFIDDAGQKQQAYFTFGYSHLFDRGSAVEEMREAMCRIFYSNSLQETDTEDSPPLWHGNIVRVCEKCGNANVYKAQDRGKVQRCDECGAYIDVPAIGEQDDEQPVDG